MAIRGCPLAWAACPCVLGEDRPLPIVGKPALVATTLAALEEAMQSAPLRPGLFWVTWMLAENDVILPGRILTRDGSAEVVSMSASELPLNMSRLAAIRRGMEEALWSASYAPTK